MDETITIGRTDWMDICAGVTRNPTAEESIIATARRGELLVRDEEGTFVPVERDGGWHLVRVLTEDEIAETLHLRYPDAHRLLLEANVPIFAKRKRLFSDQPLWAAQEVESALTAYSARVGLKEREAALELGLTVDSYRKVANSIRFASEGRVLKPLAEAFRDQYVPRDTVWSTRTALIQEFVKNFNRTSAVGSLTMQLCDVPGCGHVASDQCCNPSCRENAEGRFLCPAHAKWVDVVDAVRRPPSLCPTCTAAVEEGRLTGFRLL